MVSFFLGAALAMTMPPFAWGWLAPLPLALLLRTWEHPRPARSAFLAGLGFWGVHLIWLPQSFTVLFGPLGALPFVPMIVFEAGLWALLVSVLGGRGLALVGGWVLLDYLRAHLGVLAFPWGDLGYALTEAPGRLLAAVGGVHLLTLVVLLTGYALFRRRYLALAFWALLWWLPLPQAVTSEQALLVQGAIDPLAKVQGVNAERRYLELTRAGLAANPQVKTVVWPETAVPRLPPGLQALLGSRALIAGVAAYEGGYRNRIVWWQDGAVRAVYDKHRLVPFGEFFPWRPVLGPVYNFFFDAFGLGPLADTVGGKQVRPLGPYGAYVCYDSVFPGIPRQMVREGAAVLVNVSNDAWFGPTFGAAQHFAMGRLRAVETGRWLLRAGNDGITAVVDPYGRVTARIARGKPDVLVANYALRNDRTPYVRFGEAPVFLIALGLLGFGWRPRRARSE